jgi:protein O-GlcNAc transferase
VIVADPPREAADDPAIILQQAAILHKQRNIDAAEDMYRRVLLADPGNPDALRLLGEIAAESRSYDVAEQLIARAVKIAPVSGTYASLAVARMRRGDVEGAVWAYQRALDLEPSFLEARDRLIFALDLHPWVPWDVKLAARREFDERHGKALTLAAPPHRNSRDPERKLRIGYISADFTYHSAAAAFGPVVLNHDERRFETYLYNVVDRAPDEMAERFKRKADVWYDIAEATPSELAEVIRKDRIDILVDLSGYSAGNRLPTFARKPAPIQVTGWGYATGTGLSAWTT